MSTLESLLEDQIHCLQIILNDLDLFIARQGIKQTVGEDELTQLKHKKSKIKNFITETENELSVVLKIKLVDSKEGSANNFNDWKVKKSIDSEDFTIISRKI